MIETLEKSCIEMGQVLAQVEESCVAMLNSFNEFERCVGHYALDRLNHKLLALVSWVTGHAKSLYREHGNRGYVCVFLNETNGASIHWVQSEEVVAVKAWYKSFGTTVLSVDEMVQLIFDQIGELASGNWAEVVEWMHKYGIPPDSTSPNYCDLG